MKNMLEYSHATKKSADAATSPLQSGLYSKLWLEPPIVYFVHDKYSIYFFICQVSAWWFFYRIAIYLCMRVCRNILHLYTLLGCKNIIRRKSNGTLRHLNTESLSSAVSCHYHTTPQRQTVQLPVLRKWHRQERYSGS